MTDTKLTRVLRALEREREFATAAADTIKRLLVKRSWHLTCAIANCGWRAELIAGLDRSTAEIVGRAHQHGHEGQKRVDRRGVEALDKLVDPAEIAAAVVRLGRERGATRGETACAVAAELDARKLARTVTDPLVFKVMSEQWPAAELAHAHDPKEAA